MASRRNVVALLVLVTALVLVASGCGGSGDSSGDDTAIETTTETDATTETETEATETEETETEETDADAGLGALADEDCLELASIGAKFSEALGATGATDYEATSELFDELVDKAPDEIKNDLAIFAGAWKEIAAALADVDLSSGATPSPETIQKLQELGEKFNTPELTKALENLGAWTQEHCGTTG